MILPFKKPSLFLLAGCCCCLFGAPPEDAYVLLFEDEFNGTELDTENGWFHRVNYAQGGLNLPQNVRVADGNLVIDFKKELIDGVWEYTCGGAISRALFGYGYYEVRSKAWGGSRGLHTSFWTHGISKGWSYDGYDAMVAAGLVPFDASILEIDGYEIDSSAALNQDAQSNYHVWTNVHESLGPIKHPIDTTVWNVFGFEWTPDEVRWYYGGELVRTEPSPWVYAPQNLWLTALATPDWYQPPRPPIEDENLPGKSEWDYFRFYAKRHPGANLIGNPGFEFYPLDRPEIDPIANPKAWIETGMLGSSLVRKLSPRSGERMLVHEGDAAYSVTTKQILEYIPNSLYRLSAWVKSSGGQPLAEIRVSGHGGPDRVVPIPPAVDWTELVIDDIKVTTHTAVVSFVSQAGAGQWLNVDDVDFHHVTASESGTVVDNGDAGYSETGSWLNSGLTGWNGSSTRYSSEFGATTEWVLNVPGGQKYDVYIYKVAYSSNDPNARVDVVHGDSTATVHLDYSTGASGWVFLGSYFFPAGAPALVRITNNTEGKIARADAVWAHASPAAPEVLVKVGLEMSTDGQTWLPAEPGLYDSATGTPDFRVIISLSQ